MAFAHLTIAVRDVAAARRFYHETLGWRPIYRPPNIDFPAAWLEIAPGQELHVLEVQGFEPTPYEREFGRHFAISFPKSEFPALKARLESQGARLIAPIRETPFERFFFRDPNGYVFEVVEEVRPDEKTLAPEE